MAPTSTAGPQSEARDETPGFFATMSPRVRLLVGSVALAGLLGLLGTVLLPLLGGQGWANHAAVLVMACSALSLLACLHGHGTSCPHCGKWWSRTRVKTEDAGRELVHRDGATIGRSTTRIEFQCSECRHRWAVTEADEYPVVERPQRAGPGRSGPGLRRSQ